MPAEPGRATARFTATTEGPHERRSAKGTAVRCAGHGQARAQAGAGAVPLAPPLHDLRAPGPAWRWTAAALPHVQGQGGGEVIDTAPIAIPAASGRGPGTAPSPKPEVRLLTVHVRR